MLVRAQILLDAQLVIPLPDAFINIIEDQSEVKSHTYAQTRLAKSLLK